nr:hypothetical protein [Tanacetum cinerariifolium]
RKVSGDVGENDDFIRGSWLSVVEYVNVDGGIVSGCFGDIKRFLKNVKLEKVVAIIKSCTPSAYGESNNPHILPKTATTTQTLLSSQNHQVDNYGEKPIRIVPVPAGIVQDAKLCKIADTQEDIKRFLKNVKLEKVVAIIKSCTSSAYGEWFGKAITIAAALILHNEITKKQKMDEEAEELKSHLQIVSNDDDVYTEATPLASKIPIIDYKIHFERNKPYFIIIRADANDLSNLMMQLIESVNERWTFIEELERLMGSLVAYKTREKIKSLQKDDLVKVMELRRIVLQLCRQVHKEVDFYLTLILGDGRVVGWIVPVPAGIVQDAKLCKIADTQEGGEQFVMSTQEYIRKVSGDVGENDDFIRGSWLSVVEYVNVDGGIVSGCFGDIK